MEHRVGVDVSEKEKILLPLQAWALISIQAVVFKLPIAGVFV